MNYTEALTLLLSRGAPNTKELITALQAVQANSPIKRYRVRRAVSHALARTDASEQIQLNEAERLSLLEFLGVILT